ncbi:MAG: hypothetical protein ACI9D0_002150 [Bacteroidia bacterium]|jgi:hypothetical protein
MFLTALLLAASASPTPFLGILANTSAPTGPVQEVVDRNPIAQDPAPENSPPQEDPEAREQLPDNVVARLDGVDISLQQYKDELFKIYGYGALSEFLHRRLLAKEARRLSVAVTAEELELGWQQEWAAMLARSRGIELDVRENLKAIGYTPEQYKDQFLVGMHATLLENRIIQTLRVPTEAQLLARFDLVYGLNGERVVLRHLMLNRSRTKTTLRSLGTAPELMTNAHLDAEIQRKSAELLALAQGDEDFEALCRAHSHDISVTQNGGVIPNYNFKHYGELIAAAVHAATVGEIIGPIQAPSATHLLKVESRVITEFATVKDALIAELMAEPPVHVERAALKARLASETVIERR